MKQKLNNHYHGETPNCCPKCGGGRRIVYGTEPVTEDTCQRYNECAACKYRYTSIQSR